MYGRLNVVSAAGQPRKIPLSLDISVHLSLSRRLVPELELFLAPEADSQGADFLGESRLLTCIICIARIYINVE